ncbi:MAG: outer membrane lipoprotein carrier protein LolA [Bdellovibrio sp.]
MLIFSLFWMSYFSFSAEVPKRIAPKASSSLQIDFRSHLRPFAQIPELKIDYRKIQTSQTLKKEKRSRGRLFLTGRNFRLEEVEPDRTTLIFDGKSLWTLQYPPEAFGDTPDISRLRVNQNHQEQMLLLSLLKGQFDQVFRVQSKSGKEYLLELKRPVVHVQDLRVRVQDAGVESVGWTDELGNRTFFLFENFEALAQRDRQRYQFKPPKGVAIMEIE